MTARSLLALLLLLPVLGLDLGCSEPPPTEELPAFVKGEVLVRYHKEVDQASEDAVLERHGLQRLGRHPLLRVDHVAVETGRDVMDAIAEIEQDPDVLYAEPNFLYRPCDLPDDFNSKLWFLHNDGTYGSVDADTDAREAWNTTTGSSSIIVAVLDTGVDRSHPDLSGNMWVNHGEIAGNGVDDDGNGYVDDRNGWDFYSWDANPSDAEGHGTHVAGTIGAEGNNGSGVVGVNWDVTIMPLRFLGPGGGALSDAVTGIEYAVDHGAHVINNSWGSYGYSNALRDAIAYANENGVLFTAAAGNEANNNDSYAFYPASYDVPNVVAVAATDPDDDRASFSNWGASRVDLGAPGQWIFSTWTGGGYAWLSGTSMATPVVSGAAALALAVDPTLEPAELKQLLMDTTDPVSSMQGRTVSGGRLNARALVEAVAAGAGEPPPEEEEPPPEEEQPPPEEEEPPPEEEEPPQDQWTYVEHWVNTPHYYPNNYQDYVIFDVPGASEMRFHFNRLQTEQGYDHVYLAESDGSVLASYTGNFGGFVSDPVAGDRVVLWLITDYSVRDWGYRLAGYSYR